MKNNNILEKKWIAIIRLQKKIIELEQQIEQLNETLHSQKGHFRHQANLDPD